MPLHLKALSVSEVANKNALFVKELDKNLEITFDVIIILEIKYGSRVLGAKTIYKLDILSNGN